MKKFNSLVLIVSIISCLFVLTGCNKKDDNKETEKNTVATKLVEEFKSIIKEENDIEKVANQISESEIIQIAVGVVDVTGEEFLDGFEDIISGFDKGYAIKPMIGSQPFIAYVFEANDGEKFSETLKNKANKRWNICTEADELEISVVNNYVFVVMSPTSFDE